VAEKYSLTEKAAHNLVKKTDKNRANYYNLYTGKNWCEASNYDLCINTSRLEIAKAAEIIIKALPD
jgi:cytidylate kinase